MKRARAGSLLFSLSILGGMSARSAAGDPPGPEARERMEERFVLGLLDGLGDDPIARRIRDEWWRPASILAKPTTPSTETGLAARRLAWLDEVSATDTPFPVPAAGEVDPFPRLAAFVLDRQRRESRGVTGLPDDGPLHAFAADPNLGWFIENVVRLTYLGPQRDTLPKEILEGEQKQVDERQALADRNRLLGIGSVLALLVLGLGLAFVARPRAPSGS